VAHSGKDHRRDRDARRWHDEEEVSSPHRVFRMSESQRQEVAKSLRYIDEARRVLERQENPDNREIIRELRASADHIFELLNDLEEIES
jgi:glycerol-3-phosphate cytidylyltransferase-like family protein